MSKPPFRADMPALEETVYLNTGASGPSPRSVVDATADWLAYHAYEAPTSPGMYPAAHEAFAQSRKSIANFIGATEEEIALTNSTVDGITRFAAALDWHPDDVVVRTDMEHPAGILQWHQLERSVGISVEVVENSAGKIDLDSYIDAVSEAKLVCFSAVTWNYGTTLPVRELTDIAHENGALVLIDGVQAVGQHPIDVNAWGADAVAAAGHKWLLGPWGAGFLHVDATVADRLTPSTVGYWTVEDPASTDIEFHPGARRFELGTRSPAPHVGLRTALETIESVGFTRIQSRIERLTDRFKASIPDDRLVSPSDYETGLVTISDPTPEETVERLRQQNIVIRNLPDGETIRASIHAFNTVDDIDRLTSALGFSR